jgi:membrane protein DedA with SNARE-associated domain
VGKRIRQRAEARDPDDQIVGLGTGHNRDLAIAVRVRCPPLLEAKVWSIVAALVLDSLASVLQNFVRDIGYPGLFLLIVLESTFVPVPSLLIMPFAGFLAQRGDFSLAWVLAINSSAALTGSLASYGFGAFGGQPLLLKYGKYIFVRPADLEKTQQFFARHGAWTVFIGRFVPVVRHVISVPAGIARMPLRQFLLQTFLGSSLWGGGLIVVGYVLGSRWESIAKSAKRIDLVIAIAIALTILAFIVRFMVRRRRDRRELPLGDRP